MNYKIKNVLLKLIDRGFEAYLVGGFVRDYILGSESFDVDISTNALPKDVMDIFEFKIIVMMKIMALYILKIRFIIMILRLFVKSLITLIVNLLIWNTHRQSKRT